MAIGYLVPSHLKCVQDQVIWSPVRHSHTPPAVGVRNHSALQRELLGDKAFVTRRSSFRILDLSVSEQINLRDRFQFSSWKPARLAEASTPIRTSTIWILRHPKVPNTVSTGDPEHAFSS